MAKLTLVKRIVNEEVINSFNLIMNILFGGKVPEIYDENKIYNKGDCVIIVEDGKHKIVVVNIDNVTGPFNPDFFDDIVFTDLFKDSTILTQNDATLQTKQQAVANDISTLLFELAGIVDNRLELNTMYRENFRNADFINIINGLHVPGHLQSIPGNGLDFELKEPVILKINPTSFKIKHIIEMMGVPTLGCNITFNALDSEPYWFSANEAMLSADFFEIPLDKFIKEEDKPFALNIKIFGSCDENSSLKVSDLMVVYN
jgi:hypothetical protein